MLPLRSQASVNVPVLDCGCYVVTGKNGEVSKSPSTAVLAQLCMCGVKPREAKRDGGHFLRLCVSVSN